MNSMLPKLPIDISDFALLRKKGYLYIDKTQHAFNLITGGRRFFLARPRRFGKSLFVSTLDEILRGNKSLFKGLWIAKSSYRWPEHGVINLDFSSLESDSLKGFKKDLAETLEEIATHYKIKLPLDPARPASFLKRLVKALHAKFGHVAVLIDEYDAPMIQALSDKNLATSIRKTLKSFFTLMKSLDKYVDFVFITGVSSFTKAGIFSGMNTLKIISLNPQYATLCGYTDKEIDSSFEPYLAKWSSEAKIPSKRLREEIRSWYNGYRFSEDAPTVYNPFSLINAFDVQTLRNFWFNSGTPTFLIEELKKEQRRKEREIFEIENIQGSKDLLESFDLYRTPLAALLFQTGYLTLSSYREETGAYQLKCPNFEVKTSLHKHLLNLFGNFGNQEEDRVEEITLNLKTLLEGEEIDKAVDCLRGVFAHVPAQLHMDREQFYHALLQVACVASGIEAQAEYATSQGRIDLVLQLPKVTYLIEIKIKGSAKDALSQILRQKYYEPFLSLKKGVILLGLAIKRQTKKKGGRSQFELSHAHKRIG